MPNKSHSKALKIISMYEELFIHHVEAIMSSKLLLDEDAHLLASYWEERRPPAKFRNSKWYLFTGCMALTAAVTSYKFETYSYALLSIPFVSLVCYDSYRCFSHYKSKKEFRSLVKYLRDFHEFNKAALNYLNIREITITNNVSNSATFMNLFFFILLKILETLKDTILIVSKEIPIVEPFNWYVSNYDLKEFRDNDFKDSRKTLLQLDKMCDLFILIVSNFLSCVGLSFCTNIWQDKSCNFQIVFKLVPTLINTLEETLIELSRQLEQLRHSLESREILRENDLKNINSCTIKHLYKPLNNFLNYLQLSFELSKILEKSLFSGSEDNISSNADLVHEIYRKVEICQDNLHLFMHNFEIYTKTPLFKQPSVQKNVINITRERNDDDDDTNVSETLLDQEIDFNSNVGDEEYSLFIKADENVISEPTVDSVEQLSSDCLELLLAELKRTLEERKLKSNSNHKLEGVQNSEMSENKVSLNCNTTSLPTENSYQEVSTSSVVDINPSPPPPPPPPPVPAAITKFDILKNDWYNSNQKHPFDVLNQIKLLARQMKRDEDTYELSTVNESTETSK